MDLFTIIVVSFVVSAVIGAWYETGHHARLTELESELEFLRSAIKDIKAELRETKR